MNGATKIHLRLNGQDLEVTALDRARVHVKNAGTSITVGELQEASIHIIKDHIDHEAWIGNILFSEEEPYTGTLCIVTQQNDGVQRSLSWSQIPHVLDIFDGGYHALKSDESGQLLDDITEFNELVTSWIYHRNSDGTESRIAAQLIRPEPLNAAQELAFRILNPHKDLLMHDVVVMQMDLFEQTYFCVGIVSYVENDHVFVSFSHHIYRSSRRNGRRMAVSSTKIGDWNVLDVGDFGLRAQHTSSDLELKLGQQTYISLPSGFDVPLTVVAIENLKEETEVRFWLKEDSPEIRRHWQQFIQGLYYPNLVWRNAENYQQIWKVYKDSGYLNSFLGEWLEECKDDIFREWNRVDEVGPALGGMVLGINNKHPTGTIGVSKFAGGAWLAQAAAMSDKPEDMNVTRQIYSWRTRMILMQADGLYHVAIFERQKKFLERFFRKFYLQLHPEVRNLVTWNEKIVTAVWNENAVDSNYINSKEDLSQITTEEPLLQILAKDNSKDCYVYKKGDDSFIVSRPHLHLVQFTTSHWRSKDSLEISSFLPGKFYTRFEDGEIQKEREKATSEKKLKSLGLNVVWTAHRNVLEMFCFSSSKSIELMSRKYQPESNS